MLYITKNRKQNCVNYNFNYIKVDMHKKYDKEFKRQLDLITVLGVLAYNFSFNIFIRV